MGILRLTTELGGFRPAQVLVPVRPLKCHDNSGERGFGLRWRNDIQFKSKRFLSICERALAHIFEDTICCVAVVVVNILSYV